MRFRAPLDLHGKTATGIRVPDDVVAALGAGKKPPVAVTINGYTYRTTVASRGDRFLVGVSADVRAAAGVAAGDELDVELVFDTAPRDVRVPPELAARLASEPEARAFFEGLSFSRQRWFVDSIEGAKTPETRDRRVAKAVATLREGRAR